jgi:hypothetical protein
MNQINQCATEDIIYLKMILRRVEDRNAVLLRYLLIHFPKVVWYLKKPSKTTVHIFLYKPATIHGSLIPTAQVEVLKFWSMNCWVPIH